MFVSAPSLPLYYLIITKVAFVDDMNKCSTVLQPSACADSYLGEGLMEQYSIFLRLNFAVFSKIDFFCATIFEVKL